MIKIVVLIIFISIVGCKAQENNDVVYYEFFDDSIKVEIDDWSMGIEPNQSLIIMLMLTNIEFNGIEFYEELKRKGWGWKSELNFEEQLYKIWNKNKGVKQ